MAKPDQTSPFGILGRALGVGPLGGLKRYLRWFNLTMLQQALWPLLIAVASAPQVDIERTPSGWFMLRLLGPVAAVLLALVYLRQISATTGHSVIPSEAEESLVRDRRRTPQTDAPDQPETSRRLSGSGFRAAIITLIEAPPGLKFPAAAAQIRYALLALPIVIIGLRLVQGPLDEATKIIAFGAANVAAYHLIHFGVVPRAFDNRRQGLVAGAALFGLSWGLYNALMFGLTDDGNWLIALAAGCLLGWLTAALSLAIRSWPGGALTAAAAHFLVVYLVAGFA